MFNDLIDRFLGPLRRSPLTRSYPADGLNMPPGVRGLPELDAGACDASGDCARVCPAAAIVVDGTSWALDAGRCIFCGDCVRACPRGALRLGEQVELASRARTDLVIIVPLAIKR